MKRMRWTQAQIEHLLLRYQSTTVAVISAELGRTYLSTRGKLHHLGVTKVRGARPATRQPPRADDDHYPPGISHPRPGVTVHRMRR